MPQITVIPKLSPVKMDNRYGYAILRNLKEKDMSFWKRIFNKRRAISKKPTSQKKSKKTQKKSKQLSHVQTFGNSDPLCNIIHGLLIQRDGTWIKMGDHDQNAKAAVGCFIEWRSVLGNKFRGALVFQNANDLNKFLHSEISSKSLKSLGRFKLLNLLHVGENRLFKNLSNSNTLFLLTVPLLRSISISALAMRVEKDTSGLVALWYPMCVIILVRNPSKMTFGKIDRRRTKPCCASVSSLMGLEGFLRKGKETILDEKSYMEAQKFLKRFDI